jgi:hypothetical protein
VQSFDYDVDDARSHHSERASRAHRYIDDASLYEWPTIIDAAMDGMTGVRDGDNASKRPGSMGAGHLALMAASPIVGSDATFSPRRIDERDRKYCD